MVMSENIFNESSYVAEFKKVYEFLKKALYKYNKDILAKNNVPNPLDDKKYNEIINQLKHINSDDEYVQIINQFLVSLHSGHVYMLANKKMHNSSKILPIVLQYSKGKYYVSKSLNPLFEGKEVTKINGENIDKYVLQCQGSCSFEYGKCYIKRLVISSDTQKMITIDHQDELLEPVESSVFKNENDRVSNNVIFYYINGLPYLRINSFSHSLLNNDEIYDFFGEKINGAYEYIKRIANYLNDEGAKSLIIDIRGNNGGSDEWFKLLSYFSNQDYRYTCNISSNVGKLDCSQINEIYQDGGEDIDKSLERINQSASELEYCIGIQNGGSTIENRYLLIDDENYSTSDTLAKLANKTGFAKTIGKHTSGDGFGITPYIFTTKILEKNGIKIAIPSTFYNLNEFQTVPDIIMEDDLIMPYDYGSIKDNQLQAIINYIYHEYKNSDILL